MTNLTFTMDTAVGCPSGFSPPSDRITVADPAPFVRQHDGEYILELSISGAKCAGCIGKIERGMFALNGVTAARLNLSTNKLVVHWTGSLAARRIVDTVASLGYGAVPFDPAEAASKDDPYGKLLLRCMAVAGFAAANIMLLSVAVWASTDGEMGEATRSFLHLISGLIAIPAALYAGRPFFSSAIAALKERAANMDVPISLAVVLALGVSLYESLSSGHEAYFDAAVMLLFFLLIGRWLDHRLRRRARSAARDLLAVQATTATRIDQNGHASSIAARDITIGDRLSVTAGDRIPVDVTVESGQSDIDTSFLTGETVPVTATPGMRLGAGAINLSCPLIVTAESDTLTSTIAELVRLVEAGQQGKSRFTRLADRAARAYVPIVHSAALATFLGWLFFAGAPVREAIMAATAVLIITCPCALGLATPAVQVVATGQLFRRGILVKTGDALERLASVQRIVFDKTGTLTTGQLRLLDSENINAEQLSLLAPLARASRHPVARAIATAAGPGPLADDVEEFPGRGVSGTVDGTRVWLGRKDHADHDGVSRDPFSGGIRPTAFFRAQGGAPIALEFEDSPRDDAHHTVSDLKRRGMTISLLSGDRAPVVADLAQRLGIADWHAAVSPMEKAEMLKTYNEQAPTAMVGDGINDTGALAHAAVSLSPGTAASAAQSTADFVFQEDGLSAVTAAHEMAIKARRRILENFAFAAAYNAVAAPAAMLGLVNPLIAALAMSGSSIVVTLNALRLAGKRGDCAA